MKKITIGKKELVSFLIVLLLIICIFFPGDTLNLNVVFWAAACLVGIEAFVSSIRNKKYSYIIFMGTVFPFMVMVWSFIITGNITDAITGAYCPVYILLVVLIRFYNINYEKKLMVMLEILALFTICILLLDIMGVSDVNTGGVNTFVYKYDMGVMGKSSAYAVYYKIFFKTSPLLLLLFPYCMKEKNYFMIAIVFFALVISGTRANIFVGVVVLLFGIFNLWNKNKKSKMIIVVGSLVILLLLFPTMYEIFRDMMYTEGSISSDEIRNGQLYSFFKVFSNPSNLILGQGFGSEFWDSGRMAYVSSSEISYLDLLRKMGLICFIPFAYFVLKPFKFKINLYLKVVYMGYLIIALTNPLLFSTTAFVMYIYLYSEEYKINENANLAVMLDRLE